MIQNFTIRGSARALPEKVILADELDVSLGLSKGWTARHTGVLRRHRCSGLAESDALTRKVCFGALQDAGLGLRDLDLIVDASLCVQQPIPCNAALVQACLGPDARGIACMDVHASCLGFIAALNAVNGLFATGAAHRALIVCSESHLKGVNWDEPESACLMGDAAAAFVVESTLRPEPCQFLMETYAEGASYCEVKGGSLRMPSYDYSEARRADYLFHMDGKAVHRLASQLLPSLIQRVLSKSGRRLEELHVVPHQASGPALDLMRRRLVIPADHFHVSIGEHGNLVAASIPYVLDAVRRTLPAGTPVLLMGTAAGYTQAAALFTL